VSPANRLSECLDDALHADVTGPLTVSDGPRAVHVDVVSAGPIGVRVTQVRVRAPRGSASDTARDLPERLRALGEPIAPVEVDDTLGGATLRTEPSHVRGGEFYDVQVRGDDVTVARYRARQGGRDALAFDVTRRQLGRLVDALDSTNG